MSESIRKFFSGLTLQRLIPALLILVIGFLLAKLLCRLFSRALTRSRLHRSLHSVLNATFRIVLYTLVCLIAASALGINVSSLIAVFSVLSLAISLAVQGTLSNVAGGVQVLSAHPFEVGDFIEIAGNSGTVEETGLIYTIITTADGKRIYIPNSDVATSTLVNYTTLGRRRVDLSVTASYDAPTETVLAALRRAAAVDKLLEDEPVAVRLNAYQDSAIEYVVRVWCRTADYWDVYYEILEKIRAEFARDNVEMTYPHLNVHIDPQK